MCYSFHLNYIQANKTNGIIDEALQSHSLINCRKVSAKVKVEVNVNEAKDFLRLIEQCHIVAVVMHHFGMRDLKLRPTRNALIADSSTPHNKWNRLKAELEAAVDNYCTIPRQFACTLLEETTTDLHQSFNHHTSRIATEHSYCHLGSAVTTASLSRSLPGTIV